MSGEIVAMSNPLADDDDQKERTAGMSLLLRKWDVCINFPPLGFAGQVSYDRTHLDTNSA